jgi:hypothetical protein
VRVPSPLKPKKIKDDLEFELLLCLASTLESRQRAQDNEAKPPPEFPHTKNRKSLKTKDKKVIDSTKKEK